LRSAAGFLAPGPTSRTFPIGLRLSVARALLRVAVGIPGHSGGSAPDLHRLPFATDRS